MAYRWRIIQRADGVPNRSLGDWIRDPLNRDRAYYLERRRRENEAAAVEKEMAASNASIAGHITAVLTFLARFQPLRNTDWIVNSKSAARLTSVEQASAWLKKSMET
jgi:hypothetical protein